jgi:hypothetical protein
MVQLITPRRYDRGYFQIPRLLVSHQDETEEKKRERARNATQVIGQHAPKMKMKSKTRSQSAWFAAGDGDDELAERFEAHPSLNRFGLAALSPPLNAAHSRKGKKCHRGTLAT